MTIAFEDYRRQDLMGLADLIRRRELSALEVVDAAIARAEAVNGRINALVEPLFEAARREARTPRPGPLCGCPFVIKDLNHGVKGARLTGGSRAFQDVVVAEDGETPRRYRRAGLILIGTSTTPEFGITTTTESALHGPTRNPWALDRSAGGSSGGSAALVAAGVLPAAHATDGGGSIRIPAACCGLVGLKPSRGRAPVGDGRTEGWNGLGVSHAVTRTVRDSALLLDMICGPEPGARSVAPPEPAGGWLASLRRPPPRLRVALQTRAFTGLEPDPEVRDAVLEAGRLLEALGHEVVEATPRVDGTALGGAMGRLVAAHTAYGVDQRSAALGRPLRADELEPATWGMVELGRSLSAAELIRADHLFMETAQEMARFHAAHDLLVSPTVATPPPPLGRLGLDQSVEAYGAAVAAFSPYTALHNQTGQPAISLPLAASSQGLPIGVQFGAAYGREDLLLGIAAELETARPWFDRVPRL